MSRISLGRDLQAQSQAPSNGVAGSFKQMLQVKNIILGEEWLNSDDVSFTDVFCTAREQMEDGTYDIYQLDKIVVKTSLLPKDLTQVTHFGLSRFYRMVNKKMVFTTVPYSEKDNADFYEADGVTPIESKCVPTNVQIVKVHLKSAPVVAKRPQTEENISRPQKQTVPVQASDWDDEAPF